MRSIAEVDQILELPGQLSLVWSDHIVAVHGRCLDQELIFAAAHEEVRAPSGLAVTPIEIDVEAEPQRPRAGRLHSAPRCTISASLANRSRICGWA